MRFSSLSLLNSLSEMIMDESQGCRHDVSQEIFLVSNNGVVMQQIAQWMLVIVLPVTTIVFIGGGIQACRTHGCAFDSIVLYLCAIYNMIYMFEDLIKCSEAGQLTKTVCYTAGILYLFFNFEQMLTDMEADLQALQANSHRQSKVQD